MDNRDPNTPFAAPCIAVAALLWASAGVMASLAPQGTSAPALAMCRLVLGGLGLAASAGPRTVASAIATLPLRPLLAATVAMALFQWTFFASIPGAGAGASALLSAAAAPFFADLGARRRPQMRWLFALCCAGAAATVLACGHARAGALLLATASGAAYAAYACIAARLGQGGEHHSMAATAIALLAAGLALAPLAGSGLHALANLRGASVAACLGLLATALAYRLFVPALLRLGPGKSLGLLYIQPLAALLAGWLLLGEPLGRAELAAIVLLAAAELLRAGSSPTNHQQEQTI